MEKYNHYKSIFRPKDLHYFLILWFFSRSYVEYQFECKLSQYESDIKQVLTDNSGDVVDGDHYYEFEPHDQVKLTKLRFNQLKNKIHSNLWTDPEIQYLKLDN